MSKADEVYEYYMDAEFPSYKRSPSGFLSSIYWAGKTAARWKYYSFKSVKLFIKGFKDWNAEWNPKIKD